MLPAASKRLRAWLQVCLVGVLLISLGPQARGEDGMLGVIYHSVFLSDVERLQQAANQADDSDEVDEIPTTGVLVTGVLPSASEQVGLKVDDVLLKVGEQEILSPSDLTFSLRNLALGDEVECLVWRGGRQQVVRVVVSVRQDIVLEELTQNANAGEVWAQSALAQHWLTQAATPEQIDLALKWTRQLSDEGDITSMLSLANLYASGQHVAMDKKRSGQLLRKAAKQNCAVAMYRLGLQYTDPARGETNYLQVVSWVRKAAELHDTDAIVYLGWAYENGLGAIQDGSRARELYLQAAERGNSRAQLNAGISYLNGLGGPAEPEKAFELFGLAADQGALDGLFYVAYCYHNGAGVQQDFAEAQRWYQKAAEAGHALSKHKLGGMYLFGQGQVVDYQAALEVFRETSKAGITESYLFLGDMFRNGWGVPRSGYAAIKMYLMAEALGDTAANLRLQQIGARLFPPVPPVTP